MTCKSASYKKLKTRMRKSLGADKAYSVAVPLAKLLMEYSKKACKSEFNGEFFQNISQSAMDPCNMILGLVYMERLRRSRCSHFDAYDPSQLYASALLLANKFLNDAGNDDFIWNDDWAESLGIKTSALNDLELRLLKDLNWNIYVSGEFFEDVLESFECYSAIDAFVQNGQLTYSNFVNVIRKDLPVLKLFAEQFWKLIVILLLAYCLFTLLVISIVTFGSKILYPINSHHSCTTPNINISATPLQTQSDLISSLLFPSELVQPACYLSPINFQYVNYFATN